MELQSVGVIPSAGWASQRTSLVCVYERRMKIPRGTYHQLVVTNAPHATGRGVVTFVSHALLLRILSLEHLEGDTEAQKAKVQPLLDLIRPFALQPQGEEAKEGEPDGEDSRRSGDDDQEGGSEDSEESDGESWSPETGSSSDDDGESDGANSSRAARPASAAGASAFGQRAPDVAFSELVRVPTGIVWRGIAIDAYQHKGQVSGLRSQRRLHSATAALALDVGWQLNSNRPPSAGACPRSLTHRSLTLRCPRPLSVLVQLLWNMRPICRVLGPKGMRLSGCRLPADIVHSVKTTAGGQRLIAAAGGGAASCSTLVSGVPSPPGMRHAPSTASFVSSPMLLLIFDWVAKLDANQAAAVQRGLKDMRDDVEGASSPRGSGASAADACPAPPSRAAASSPVQVAARADASSQPGSE